MGHERVGALPKSKQWRQVVEGLSSLSTHPGRVDAVAADTLSLVRDRFRALQNDPALHSSFSFLVKLAVSARNGQVPGLVGSTRQQAEITPILVAISLKRDLEAVNGNQEHGALSRDAAVDAIAKWYASRRDKRQESLFGTEFADDPWGALGGGAGFCELSRQFFASLTERYLNYFLEREAATALATIQDRQTVRNELRAHVDSVSRHAFETALITQSFAAGWFNANAIKGAPSDESINRFVAHAMGKMRGELNREAAAR